MVTGFEERQKFDGDFADFGPIHAASFLKERSIEIETRSDLSRGRETMAVSDLKEFKQEC